MPKQLKKPEPLKDLLSHYLKEWRLSTSLNRAQIVQEWPSIVGAQIASRTQALQCVGDCLVVSVDHSAWMHQLNLLKPQLLKKISEIDSEKSIQDIRWILS